VAQEHNAIKFGTDLIRAAGVQVGVDDTAEGVVRLGETLTPTFDVYDRPESAFLRTERLCSAVNVITAAAGTIAAVHFLNPGTSRFLAVIESIMVATDTGGRMQLWVHHPIAGISVINQIGFRDLRLNAPLIPICQQLRSNSLAALGPGQLIAERFFGATNLNQNVEFVARPIVVPPDLPQGIGSLVIGHTTVTTPTIMVTITWRERLAYPRELRF
jgi:hypothetical protein